MNMLQIAPRPVEDDISKTDFVVTFMHKACTSCASVNTIGITRARTTLEFYENTLVRT